MLSWDSSVQELYGVGTHRAQLLEKLDISTLGDLLRHFPRSYIDLSAPYAVAEAPSDEVCAILATVVNKSGEIRARSGVKVYKVIAADDTGSLDLTFFNTKFTVDNLKYDVPYLFYGRAEGSARRRTMTAPTIYPIHTDRPFAAIYSLTAGLTGGIVSSLILRALKLELQPPEVIPKPVRLAHGLINSKDAIRAIHCPMDAGELEQARKRLVFEELFTLAVGIGTLKTHTQVCCAAALRPHSLQPFYDALPFTLTNAQLRAIHDLTADMQRPIPANRLVQGDVGSGKTMVAAAGAYFAFLSGTQSAMMAPTELLARQHYEGLSPLCEKLGMHVELLTGSMTAAQKRAVYSRLESGETDFCVGTHALISTGVAFRSLALVITDEQHRFGVAQRARLQQKGQHPHTLVMSATPIPRTLALMVYGELDISVIDELPPNRMPVKTYKISSSKRERAFGFIKEHLDKGLQAYIVCPLVEEGEESMGLQAATSYMMELGSKDFSGYSLGLLHGKLKPAQKERTMSDFKQGNIQLLVSTTVVEVGVDVPNAVIMMVENAERFGLSQLHQLRGRVGRGKQQSYCILVSDSRNPDTVSRLQMMCHSSDGFEIAEYDLKTRGPGNFLGHQQHGLPQLRIADLTTDIDLVQAAQMSAKQILEQDPKLERAENENLRLAVENLMKKVGERPN